MTTKLTKQQSEEIIKEYADKLEFSIHIKQILITVAYLDGFHGSVIHVKEYAEEFMKKNYDVSVSCIMWTNDIYNVFAKSKIHVINCFDDSIKDKFYDYIIAYHFPVLGVLLSKNVTCKKLIIGSLSGYETLESFPIYYRSASCLISMSNESKLNHNQKYDINLDDIYIIENCIPDNFFEFNHSYEGLKNIAIISNHIPQELLAIKDILSAKNINVDCIGIGQQIYELVTPDLLLKYDVIITIGKSVQYGLGMGIPVYEYDHFGGNGYITPKNYEEEKRTNFSGRSTYRKITSDKISNEIINGYSDAVKNVGILKETAKNDFLLSAKLAYLIDLANTSKDFYIEFNSNTKLEFAHNDAFCRWTKNLKELSYINQKLIQETESKLQETEGKLQETEGKLQETEGRFHELNNDLYLIVNKRKIYNKYYRYKILSKVLFGKRRKHYKRKSSIYHEQVRAIRRCIARCKELKNT